jgi:hypothetical protein
MDLMRQLGFHFPDCKRMLDPTTRLRLPENTLWLNLDQQETDVYLSFQKAARRGTKRAAALDSERVAVDAEYWSRVCGTRIDDKDIVAEVDKTQLEVNPVSGEEVEKLVKEIYATPADVVAKAKDAAK